MTATYYHGTTDETVRSIEANGLRKASFVTPDRTTAEGFARDRAGWNGRQPVVLAVKLTPKEVSPVTLDRSGRRETQTRVVARNVQRIPA